MTSVLVGVLAVAALFAAFGLVQRGWACGGACPGCGEACAHRIHPPARRDKEASRGGR